MAALAKETLDNLLEPVEVRFNGSNPWDPQIHNPGFYDRVLAGGSLALGQAYMDRWWDCTALDQLFERILRAGLESLVVNKAAMAWAVCRAKLANLQSPRRAHQIGERHYDTGNDLFEAMLDERMIYSCAYWHQAGGLGEAQEAKLDLICRKLHLKPGQRLLDIGCGWGGLAAYAAEHHGVEVVGLTVSKEQAELASQRCKGWPVDIRLLDYRRLGETFDAIVSVGMFEHVGHKNFRTYMQVVHDSLEPGGLFLLHTIGSNTTETCTDPWISQYIFPNSLIPSAGQISDASEGLLVIEDWHSFGPDYDKTLMAWHKKFSAAWHQLEPAYGQRFGRMWNYYLLCSAGAFRARMNQLWQVVLCKGGAPGGYESVR